jgi:hypothetical protein
MVRFSFALIGAVALFVCALPPSASATTVYSLSYDGCTGSCGTGPFGTVALDQTSPGTVTVSVALAGGERFAGSGAGDALGFNVAGPVTLSNITPGFAIGPAPEHASTFGTFLESITCTWCQGSHTDNPSGPLNFTVSSATGVSLNEFLANAKGCYFASDIVGTTGNTGNVAAGSVAPEPVSMSLLGVGLTGVGLMRMRRGSAQRGLSQSVECSNSRTMDNA